MVLQKRRDIDEDKRETVRRRTMRWQGRRQSSNVDDRRGVGRSGGGGRKLGGAGVLIVLVLSLLFGGPELAMKNLGLVADQGQSTEYVQTPQDEERAGMAKVVLADTEDIWHEQFKAIGRTYREPQMVLYSGYTRSACGTANSAVGPFYCPADNKIYLDLSFYDDLEKKLGAKGDFAMAYVIAHEVGHHVQTLLGVTSQMNELRQKLSKTEYNRYSVLFELQADYLAGVYAKHSEKMGYLEEGDILEAMEAAQAVGDDRIQKQAQGYVVPDSFTHGTSEQRMKWFKKGYEAGDLSEWDTFNLEK